MSVFERPGVRVVDGLAQYAILVGHDGRNHVDELRKAGDFYAVRMPDEGIGEAADEQGIFQVVWLLQKMRRHFSVAVRRIAAAGAIPDVPFIE